MSTNLKRYRQSPDEKLDRDIDFSEWLAQRQDSPASHEVIVDPPGLTVALTSRTGGIVKVWLTGGTRGVGYKVTTRLTTVDGRKKEAAIVVRIR